VRSEECGVRGANEFRTVTNFVTVFLFFKFLRLGSPGRAGPTAVRICRIEQSSGECIGNDI